MKKSIIPVFVPHLGCPHRCVFCNQREIAGKESAPDGQKTAVIIEEALKAVKEGEPEIAFYGGSFTAVPRKVQDELLRAAAPFVESGRARSIRISTRPDAVDRETLSRLYKSHVRTVELGAQSMCDDVLAASGRGHTRADTEKASAMIKEHGFSLVLQVMNGLPGDSREKALVTAERAAALLPDAARIYPAAVLRNTELFDMYSRGLYLPMSLEQAVETTADMLEIFIRHGIPVIRIGLNPTEGLSGGAVAAGAYHPALGELVRSRVYLRRAISAIERLGVKTGGVNLFVNRSGLPLMTGQRRQNMKTLNALFPALQIIVSAGEIAENEVDVRPADPQTARRFNA